MMEIVKNQVKKSAPLWHGHKKQEPDSPQQGIRLADFIHENTEQIVKEWETFAQELAAADTSWTPLALRDHIRQKSPLLSRQPCNWSAQEYSRTSSNRLSRNCRQAD